MAARDDRDRRGNAVSPPVAETETPPADGNSVAKPRPAGETVLIDEEIRDLAQLASDYYEAAQAALQDGDWATYGEELDKMEAALKEMVDRIDRQNQ